MHRTGTPPTAFELDAMQVRKIDCKPTRQRNQSSSPEKRLIWIVSFYFFFLFFLFLRCGNSNRKKYLRAVTKTTVTTWSESRWGYEALLLHDPDCQVRSQTPVLQFLGAALWLPWLQWPGPPGVSAYVCASHLIFEAGLATPTVPQSPGPPVPTEAAALPFVWSCLPVVHRDATEDRD